MLPISRPFALFDVAVLGLLAAVLWWGVQFYKTAGLAGMLRRLAVRLVVTASIVYLWFLAAWGMNYRRVPLQEQLAYDSSRLTRDRAVQFARAAVDQVNALRAGSRVRGQGRLVARRRALRRAASAWGRQARRGRRRRSDRSSSCTSARRRSTG